MLQHEKILTKIDKKICFCNQNYDYLTKNLNFLVYVGVVSGHHELECLIDNGLTNQPNL